ncbi:MAG: hypothetical protein JNK11_01065 [Alphaproteobacteria bacterium]|nr:hypothetical protein [Alphaproteobacteria bacterium]
MAQDRAERLDQPTVHATCVAFAGRPGAPAAALLLGPAGAGKSDLALRLLGVGWRLVADDRVGIDVASGEVWARCPDAIAGMIEVRGLGILRLPDEQIERAPVRVALAVRLAAPQDVPRLPEPRRWLVAAAGGTAALPEIALAPFEASAPDKVRLAVLSAVGAIVRP